MSQVSAQVSASVDKMIISHFMRDFSAQVREDVTFLHSLSVEEKAVFERAGQDTRKHALMGAVTAPALLYGAKRLFLHFARDRLPPIVKSGAFTMKVLNITAYIAASAIGGFQQAQKVVPANIERLVALPAASSIGARARASVALVDQQAKAHVPQPALQEYQLATARYMRLFPLGLTGEEHALKAAANPFLAAQAFRDNVLKRTPPSGSAAGGDDFIKSSRKDRGEAAPADVVDRAARDPDVNLAAAAAPAERPRRRSSYDAPRARDAAHEDSGTKSKQHSGSKTDEVKPAGRVVYNKWGDIVTPDDRSP
jgi:hypothetical protein